MKIIVTVDGSEESRAILPMASDLAKASGAEIKLLTVVPMPKATSQPGRRRAQMVSGSGGPGIGVQALASEIRWVGGGYVESENQALERAAAEGRDFLDDVAEPLTRAGLKVEKTVVLNDNPAEAIIAFVRREHADLVAMSTHGRTGLREVVQGSVAAAVMKAGVAPILLVRPRK
jgi:nucleotide-binding universal stress UspA family protein